jgi:hypothetical protein
MVLAILMLAAACSSSEDGASDATTTTTAAAVSESSDTTTAEETTTTTSATTTTTTEPKAQAAASGECVVGTWEQRAQEFIDAIAETFIALDDPLLEGATLKFVEGSYQVEFGADGSMLSVRDNWTMQITTSEGGLRTVLEGDETGTYSVEGDVITIDLDDSTVEVSQFLVLGDTVTPVPGGTSTSVDVEGLGGSGTFTCDDAVLAVQVEGGVPANFDRVG